MQVSFELTIDSGTALQLANVSTLVTRLAIQCQPATGDGLVYVFNGVPVGTTPATDTTPYITLAAGGTNSPSDTYSDRVDEADDFAIDLQQIWIDGSHSGDVVTVSCNRKV
jgi:hypothetical protein